MKTNLFELRSRRAVLACRSGGVAPPSREATMRTMAPSLRARAAACATEAAATGSEIFVICWKFFSPSSFLIIFFGFYPSLIIETLNVSVDNLINDYEKSLTIIKTSSNKGAQTGLLMGPIL